jgi:DNA-binding PadR family transcriptional regulator
MYCGHYSGGYGRRWRHRRARFAFGAFGPFGPFEARGRMFGPGEMRLALLSLLGEAPRHGYELMRELEDRCAGLYRPSAGTIYPTLQQLEDEGLVRSELRESKRTYSITEAGRAELERQRETVRSIWRRAESLGDWEGLHHPGAAELVRPALDVARQALRAVAHDPRAETVDALREILLGAAREIRELGERRPPR